MRGASQSCAWSSIELVRRRVGAGRGAGIGGGALVSTSCSGDATVHSSADRKASLSPLVPPRGESRWIDRQGPKAERALRPLGGERCTGAQVSALRAGGRTGRIVYGLIVLRSTVRYKSTEYVRRVSSSLEVRRPREDK